MCEKCKYDIEQLQKEAAEKGAYNFKNGLNCAESVFQAWLDLGLTEFPPEVVALSSGLGGGVCKSGSACGAITGGVLAIGTMKGRKDPFEKPDKDSRIAELNEPETGIYPRFAAYLKEIEDEWGCITCKELCEPFDMHSVERARNCKKIIISCLNAAVKHALKD